MKTNPESDLNDELRSEYTDAEMKSMVRGMYAERLGKTVSLVRLDPDVALAFPNAAAVNKALRFLLRVTNANVQKEASVHLIKTI